MVSMHTEVGYIEETEYTLGTMPQRLPATGTIYTNSVFYSVASRPV